MKKIVVEHGEQLAIAQIMRCSAEFVCRALSYRKDTPLARRVRKVAMERGGVEVELRDVQKQRVTA